MRVTGRGRGGWRRALTLLRLALAGERPYRGTLSTEQALAIVRTDSPHRLCPTCVDALAATVGEGRA